MSIDEKTIQELVEAFENKGQTVEINDGHVQEDNQGGEKN